MTAVMSQPGLGLSAPSSRQDVISALLNDYGNSFGQGNTSPYEYAQTPAFKELPPPPPSDDGKPLPPLMMRFQLRVDDSTSPISPFSDGASSPEQPTKILSRSMSRSSKPTSLKLTKSNGSTALVPADNAPPAPAKDDVYFSPAPTEERPLPPPPPPKSERRKSSLSRRESKPERRDSKEPQVNKKEDAPASTPSVKRKPVPPTKGFVSLADLGSGPRGRKPLPQPGENRRPSAARSESASPARTALDTQRPIISKIEMSNVPEIPEVPEVIEARDGPKEEAPLPAVPSVTRKPIGLPSNPRANSKSQKSRPIHLSQSQPDSESPSISQSGTSYQSPPQSMIQAPQSQIQPPPPIYPQVPSQVLSQSSDKPLPEIQGSRHTRGKSSTVLDFMKSASTFSQEPQAPNPAPVPSTITPGPTPSPRKTEAIQTGAAIQNPTLASTIQAALMQSPVSPISANDDRGPFSYDDDRVIQAAQSRPPPPPKENESPVSPPAELQRFPPRTTSRAAAKVAPLPALPVESLQPVQPAQQPIQPAQPVQQVEPVEPAPQAPAAPWPEPQKRWQDDTEPHPSSEPRFPIAYDSNSEDPFVPLTKRPIPVPPQPIRSKHLNCYTSHMNFTRYAARFQPPSCMVCHKSDPGFRATCSCCYLQLCAECDRELAKFPGRDLRRLVDERGVKSDGRESKDSVPGVVVSNIDDPADFS